MSANATSWEDYRDKELGQIVPILSRLGFSLDDTQLHIAGERSLMMARKRDVGGGGYKLVLTGKRDADGKKVVIKVSSTEGGKEEIGREREMCKDLHQIEFAYRTFDSPKEILFVHEGPLCIHITEYIVQDRSFFEHTLQEQFFLALQALEAQEGVHATTSRHKALVHHTFGISAPDAYLSSYETFAREAVASDPSNRALAEALARGTQFMYEHKTTLARFGGFLTHADFVPNNFRIAGGRLYLLDYASIHFGNKYEGWARFINFMNHHNVELEKTLVEYVKKNRSADEYLSLRLMRVYKIAFLLRFYAQNKHLTEGNLLELTKERVVLWTAALNAVLNDTDIPAETIQHYLARMSELRTEDEKARQREMLGKKIRV
jgi:hypothetical protein